MILMILVAIGAVVGASLLALVLGVMVHYKDR